MESTPPERILPEWGMTVLLARASLVMESSSMTTSCSLSTRRFAFSRTMSATWTCRLGASSKVELITSPRTFLFMSVTSSGLSSMRRTIRMVSGWLAAMLFAMCWRRKVFPARGGDTMRARWPMPRGVRMSMMRPHISSGPVSRMNLRSG